MPTTSLATTPAVRFHLSLNVADLARSVAFYRTLFNLEPAKLRADYAKFEPDDPPLVVSLEPTPRATGGPLNHLGFRLSDSKALVDMQRRLEQAGIRSQREDGVECCYARQTKFWVHDPDGTLWEVYTLDEDIEHRGAGQSAEAMSPPPATPAQANVWEHFLGQPIPEAIRVGAGTFDEVRLKGTFNIPVEPAARDRMLAEAFRILKPGGRLFVHVLTADREVPELPPLPGPAAVCKYAPQQSDTLAAVAAAGFAGARMVKYDAKPCFRLPAADLRETQIEAFKSAAAGGTRRVLYKGPFHEVVLDGGRILPRGEWVSIDRDEADMLGGPDLAGQVVVVE
jgi:catechol 2,3-dioxygenase-like lactoylglutathione lyase family enzyme